MLRLPSSLAAIVLLVAGCGGDEMDALVDRDFLLQSSQGFTPVSDTRVSLHFGKGEVGFHAGCNSHSGRLTIAGDTLVVDGFGSTAIGCDGPRHTQDAWLATFLTSRPTYSLNQDELTISGESATLVFLDREVADPKASMVSKRRG